MQQQSLFEHCDVNLSRNCGFPFFLFRKITKTFMTCLSDSFSWPVVVCLRAVSGVTRKIMRVIFQERQRDQLNNRSVQKASASPPFRCSVSSCGIKRLSIVFLAALFKCLQQKYHTVFMKICLQCDMMSRGILTSKLVFFKS